MSTRTDDMDTQLADAVARGTADDLHVWAFRCIVDTERELSTERAAATRARNRLDAAERRVREHQAALDEQLSTLQRIRDELTGADAALGACQPCVALDHVHAALREVDA